MLASGAEAITTAVWLAALSQRYLHVETLGQVQPNIVDVADILAGGNGSALGLEHVSSFSRRSVRHASRSAVGASAAAPLSVSLSSVHRISWTCDTDASSLPDLAALRSFSTIEWHVSVGCAANDRLPSTLRSSSLADLPAWKSRQQEHLLLPPPQGVVPCALCHAFWPGDSVIDAARGSLGLNESSSTRVGRRTGFVLSSSQAPRDGPISLADLASSAFLVGRALDSLAPSPSRWTLLTDSTIVRQAARDYSPSPPLIPQMSRFISPQHNAVLMYAQMHTLAVSTTLIGTDTTVGRLAARLGGVGPTSTWSLAHTALGLPTFLPDAPSPANDEVLEVARQLKGWRDTGVLSLAVGPGGAPDLIRRPTREVLADGGSGLVSESELATEETVQTTKVRPNTLAIDASEGWSVVSDGSRGGRLAHATDTSADRVVVRDGGGGDEGIARGSSSSLFVDSDWI